MPLPGMRKFPHVMCWDWKELPLIAPDLIIIQNVYMRLSNYSFSFPARRFGGEENF